MSLTKAQWKEKLSSFYPRWYFATEENQDAHLDGIAKIFEQLDGDLDNHISESFIQTSNDLYLDAHGGERSIDRLDEELDTQYRPRVRNLSNQSNRPAIKAIVDALLMVGACAIIEDFEAGVFCNREDFVNRGVIIFDPKILNTFSIIVDKQIHEPYAFVNREYFCDREDFVGTVTTSDYVFNVLVEAVNNAKALGTLYRVIERG